VEHFRCKTTNTEKEWSIYGADPETLDLATEQSGAFMVQTHKHLTWLQKKSGALYSADPQTLDLATEQSGAF